MTLLLRAARTIARTPLIGLIQGYRWFVSPMLGVNCRFAPSCSEYALEAVRSHGALRGAALAAGRLCRCHPWGGSGYDPVPPASAIPPSPHSASPASRRGRGIISCDPAR
jgi:putative membrane protein insertion efficiency factor